MTKNKSILPVILISLVLLLVFSPVFATIDDVFVASVLDGRISGAPSADTVYMGVVLSGLLSGLYRCIPFVPWFGAFQCVAVITVFASFSKRIFDEKKCKSGILFWALGSCFLFLSYGLRNLLLPTYTVTAAILAGGGLLPILFPRKEKKWKDYLLVGIFLFLSYETRSQVFFLSTPFILLAVAYRFVTAPRPDRKPLKSLGISVLVFALFMGGMVWLDHCQAVLTPEKEAYKEFNEIRTEVVDYYAIYAEGDILGYYNSVGIETEEVRLDASQLWLLKDELNTDSLEVYASYGRAMRNYSTLSAMKWALPRYFKEAVQGIYLYYNIFVLILFVIFLVQGIRYRKAVPFWRGLITFLLLLVGRSVIILYLMGTGRYPERVVTPLYFWEMLVAFRLVADVFPKAEEMPIRRDLPAFILLGLGCVFSGMFSGLRALPEYRLQAEINKPFEAVVKEMEAQPDTLYLLDTYAFCHATEKAFRFTGNTKKPENILFLGGWLPGSPLLTEKMELLCDGESAADLLKSGEAVFVTRQDTQFGPTDQIVEDYLHIDLEQADTYDYPVPEAVLNRLHATAMVFEMYHIRK